MDAFLMFLFPQTPPLPLSLARWSRCSCFRCTRALASPIAPVSPKRLSGMEQGGVFVRLWSWL